MAKRQECKGCVCKGQPEVGECVEMRADFSGESTEPYHSSFDKDIGNS